jgi:hypothetical protein
MASNNMATVPTYPPALYAKGNSFVFPRGGALPSRCVKCGTSATDPSLKQIFSWHHPALYLLALFGLFPYAIVAAIVQKRIKLNIPLCDAHKSIRTKRLWIGAVLLLTCIPVPWVVASHTIKDDGTAFVVGLLLGLGMFVTGIMFTVCESPLRAIRIGLDSAEFTGACPEFLASLGATPNVQAKVSAAGV